jgi:diguanylate cyclase (GGDEF)-like protein
VCLVVAVWRCQTRALKPGGPHEIRRRHRQLFQIRRRTAPAADSSVAPAAGLGDIAPQGGEIIKTQDDNLNLQLEMMAALPDPVFVLTESGRYAALIGGRDRSTYHDGACLVNFTLYDVLPRDKADWFAEQIQTTLVEDQLRIVEYVLSADDIDGVDSTNGPGGDIWFEGRISPMRTLVDGERAVLWVASNISRRHELETALQRLSETDELTGVYNRRKLLNTLNDRLQGSSNECDVFSLLIIDLDYFKRVNDTFGHLAGDCVLKQFAAACAVVLQDRALLARVGGEEFAVLMPAADAHEAQHKAEEIRRAIAAHRFLLEDGTPLSITVSIGISTAQPGCCRTDELIRAADDALYRAKEQGRNALAHSGATPAPDRAVVRPGAGMRSAVVPICTTDTVIRAKLVRP